MAKETLNLGVSKQSRVFDVISDLLPRAGYKTDFDFGRTDMISLPDEGVNLLAVKGFWQISFMIHAEQIDGLFLGTDVAMEVAERTGYDIFSVLDTGQQKCRLAPMARKIDKVRSLDDLRDFKFYLSKYPGLAKKWVREYGLPQEKVWEIESGSDIQVARGLEPMAAVELVSTGNTARKNGLEILDDEHIGLPPALEKISLEIFGIGNLAVPVRGRLEEMKSRVADILT